MLVIHILDVEKKSSPNSGAQLDQVLARHTGQVRHNLRYLCFCQFVSVRIQHHAFVGNIFVRMTLPEVRHGGAHGYNRE